MHARQDPEGRRLPIKLDATSNGEYEPVPLTAAARRARADAHDAIDRRGAAAGHAAAPLPRVGARCCGHVVGVRPRVRGARRARRALSASSRSARSSPTRRGPCSPATTSSSTCSCITSTRAASGASARRPNAFRGMPKSNCGKADHIECLSSEQMLKDVFLDSDTAMGVLSHVPGGERRQPARLRGGRRDARWRRMRSTAASGCCCTAA